ncbi:MAG TPA: hypothetical protein VHB21_14540 [Minicystis sp.]|nr:hypothetical protein [Minicystis sp.]
MSDVAWAKGGEARVLAVDDGRVRLASTTPAAPGAPLEGALAGGARVKVKVARCRREGDVFVVEGRLVDATRDLRAELARLAAGHSEA